MARATMVRAMPEMARSGPPGEAIGDGADGDAEHEARRVAEADGEAHHEGGVGRLQHDPAEGDVLTGVGGPGEDARARQGAEVGQGEGAKDTEAAGERTAARGRPRGVCLTAATGGLSRRRTRSWCGAG